MDYLNETTGCHYTKFEGKNKAFDLSCSLHPWEQVEVKTDRKAHITGNTCFERNLFAFTTSTAIVYVIQDTAYIFDRDTLWDDLKQLAADGKTRFMRGGDRNANPLILVKLVDILPTAIAVSLTTDLGEK